MGAELISASDAAKAVFEEVDDALGQKLSDVILEGPEDALTLTANAQPALMTVSIAALRAMEEKGFVLEKTASFVAGHSLGEYSALCAAGTFSLSDTAKLLRIRGDAMQAAVPVGEGAMAAIIGLEQSDVEAISTQSSQSGVCAIANDNGGGQLVALLLPVSAPFHSALMQPAADAMQEALADVEMSAPCVPLVANVLAGPTSDPEAIRTLLVEQVTGQVRWRECVEWLAANGVTQLFEIGSGKVLSGLARRIDRSLASANVGSPDDIGKALETIQA